MSLEIWGCAEGQRCLCPQALFGSPLGFAPITTGWSVPRVFGGQGPFVSNYKKRMRFGSAVSNSFKVWTHEYIYNEYIYKLKQPTSLNVPKQRLSEVPIRPPTNRSKGLSVPWFKASQPSPSQSALLSGMIFPFFFKFGGIC